MTPETPWWIGCIGGLLSWRLKKKEKVRLICWCYSKSLSQLWHLCLRTCHLCHGEVFFLTFSYCWWLKSCTSYDGWNPINNGIFFISTGAGFQPSTVGTELHSCKLPVHLCAITPPLRPRKCPLHWKQTKKNTPLKAKQKAQEIRRSPPDMYGNPVNYGDIPPYQLVQCIISLNKKPGKNSQRFCQRWPVWQLFGSTYITSRRRRVDATEVEKTGIPLVGCLFRGLYKG